MSADTTIAFPKTGSSDTKGRHTDWMAGTSGASRIFREGNRRDAAFGNSAGHSCAVCRWLGYGAKPHDRRKFKPGYDSNLAVAAVFWPNHGFLPCWRRIHRPSTNKRNPKFRHPGAASAGSCFGPLAAVQRSIPFTFASGSPSWTSERVAQRGSSPRPSKCSSGSRNCWGSFTSAGRSRRRDGGGEYFAKQRR